MLRTRSVAAAIILGGVRRMCHALHASAISLGSDHDDLEGAGERSGRSTRERKRSKKTEKQKEKQQIEAS